jgi:hypothetical protein
VLEAREPRDDSHLLTVVLLAGRETYDPVLIASSRKIRKSL